jgi:hypothetical protein
MQEKTAEHREIPGIRRQYHRDLVHYDERISRKVREGRQGHESESGEREAHMP